MSDYLEFALGVFLIVASLTMLGSLAALAIMLWRER